MVVWGWSPTLLEAPLFMDLANIKESAGQYMSMVGVQELIKILWRNFDFCSLEQIFVRSEIFSNFLVFGGGRGAMCWFLETASETYGLKFPGTRMQFREDRCAGGATEQTLIPYNSYVTVFQQIFCKRIFLNELQTVKGLVGCPKKSRRWFFKKMKLVSDDI